MPPIWHIVSTLPSINKPEIIMTVMDMTIFSTATVRIQGCTDNVSINSAASNPHTAPEAPTVMLFPCTNEVMIPPYTPENKIQTEHLCSAYVFLKNSSYSIQRSHISNQMEDACMSKHIG